MMRSDKVVIVFENPNSTFNPPDARRSAMASAFRGCAGTVIEASSRNGKINLVPSVKPIPAHCDLLLVHAGDHARLPDLQKYTCAKHLIFYGGNGEAENRLPDVNGLIIKRRISFARDAPSEDQAEELLHYLLTKGARLPALLTPDLGNDSLIALAILCQGYLAVSAKENPTLDGFGSETKSSLTRMGWIPGRHADFVNEELSVVQNPKWWNSALGLEVVEALEDKFAEKAAWQTFEDELAKSWPREEIPNALVDFCAALSESQGTVGADIVAKFYIQIADRLDVLGGNSDLDTTHTGHV
jgi:hypothetical protein